MSMRKENMTDQETRPMMRWFMALAALIFLASGRPAQASYPIGTFSSPESGITWTNNGTTGTLTGTETGSFSFTNMPGILDPTLTGSTYSSATMTITGSASGTGSLVGSTVVQPLDTPLTITITNNAVPGQVLLSATVSSGALSLAGTGSAAAVVASVPTDNLTYSSSVFNASALTSQAFSLALGAITAPLSLNAGDGIANSFTASGIAVFSANAVSVPEPASVALLGIGCLVLAGARSRFRRIDP